MTAISANKSIAALGGTFDPVHNGHLRTALDLQQLGFAHIHLIPCAVPYHKERPCTAAVLRWQLSQPAVAAGPALRAGGRDIARGGAAHTGGTL